MKVRAAPVLPALPRTPLPAALLGPSLPRRPGPSFLAGTPGSTSEGGDDGEAGEPPGSPHVRQGRVPAGPTRPAHCPEGTTRAPLEACSSSC